MVRIETAQVLDSSGKLSLSEVAPPSCHATALAGIPDDVSRTWRMRPLSLPGGRRRMRQRTRGAGVTRPGCWLRRAAHLDEGRAGTIMRMVERLGHGKNRGDTGIANAEERVPGVTASRPEERGQRALSFGPARPVVLVVEQGIVRDSRQLAEPRVELRLDGIQGDETAIGGFIGIVKRRTGIEQVDPAPRASSRRRGTPRSSRTTMPSRRSSHNRSPGRFRPPSPTAAH